MDIRLLHGLQSVFSRLRGKILINSDNDIITNSSNFIITVADQTSVIIDDRSYPTYRHGNKVWMTEYLDYQWSGLDIGNGETKTTPYASYYRNDESTYGYNREKLGLLYNWYALDYLEQNKDTLLPVGWRVPTKDDFEGLFDEYSCQQLRDTSKFNFKISGIFNAEIDQFTLLDATRIWTSTKDTSAVFNSAYHMNMTDDTKNFVSRIYSFEIPILLVKDIN